MLGQACGSIHNRGDDGIQCLAQACSCILQAYRQHVIDCFTDIVERGFQWSGSARITTAVVTAAVVTTAVVATAVVTAAVITTAVVTAAVVATAVVTTAVVTTAACTTSVACVWIGWDGIVRASRRTAAA